MSDIDAIAADIGGDTGDNVRDLMKLARFLHEQSAPYLAAPVGAWVPEVARRMHRHSESVAWAVNLLIDEYGFQDLTFNPRHCEDCEVDWCPNHPR